MNVKNAKFLEKGFARSPVICGTDCSNSSFLQQVDSINVRRIFSTVYYVAISKIWRD